MRREHLKVDIVAGLVAAAVVLPKAMALADVDALERLMKAKSR